MFKIFFVLLILFNLSHSKQIINVLYISSYNSNMPWTKEILQGMNTEIASQEKYKFNIYPHFFDTLRLGNDQNLSIDFKYFQERYKNLKIDFVVSDSLYANRFINQYYTKLFKKNTPIIYIAERTEQIDLGPSQYKFSKNKTYLAQKTFELARKINKKAKRVLIISNNKIVGEEIEDTIRELTKKEKMEFISLKNLSYENYEYRIAHLNSDYIFFYVMLSKDIKGENRIPKNEALRLAKISPIPTFVFHSSYLDGDVLGGYTISPFKLGKNSIKLAIDYFNKKQIDNYDFYELIFNENAIKKYGLNRAAFPSSATFINVKKSFWQEYPLETIYAISFFIILIIFIVILGKFARKLHLLNKEIKRKNEENIEHLKIIQQQAKLASMGEMIGAIAHQWRQPLNEISSRIQNIKYDFMDELVNQKYIDEFVDRSKETVKFMSQTIDDFRNFFRIDKEKIEFDIKEAIDEIVNLQNTQLKNHNIDLKIIGKSSRVQGFKSEFKQVILSIVNNAKDALIENNIPNPQILIEILNKKVVIIDNAGGVKEEIVNRIFEPYFTTKIETNGTGMGLYISKMIIENNMGGELKFENIPKGSKFIIKFK